MTEEDIQTNFEKIFGVPYSTEQDWITTTKGSVNVKANSAIKKVAIMALVALTKGDASEWRKFAHRVEVIPNMVHLNETEGYSSCHLKRHWQSNTDMAISLSAPS